MMRRHCGSQQAHKAMVITRQLGHSKPSEAWAGLRAEVVGPTILGPDLKGPGERRW